MFSPADYESYTNDNTPGRVIATGDTTYNVFVGGTYTPTGQLATGLVGMIKAMTVSDRARLMRIDNKQFGLGIPSAPVNL